MRFNYEDYLYYLKNTVGGISHECVHYVVDKQRKPPRKVSLAKQQAAVAVLAASVVNDARRAAVFLDDFAALHKPKCMQLLLDALLGSCGYWLFHVPGSVQLLNVADAPGGYKAAIGDLVVNMYAAGVPRLTLVCVDPLAAAVRAAQKRIDEEEKSR